ncbi:MAG: ribulose-phosphate 3-epimerase [Rikenellaceae bacterium]
MTRIVSPSFLSADYLNLGQEVEWLNKSEAEWFHLDVMDGIFVPNITFGFPIIKAIRKRTNKVLDAHLMIVEPEKYIKTFALSGVDFLTIHIESTSDIVGALKKIREYGMKAGVAIKPDTPVSVVELLLDYVDMILVMSVYPGFPAQEFIPESIERIAQVRQMIDAKNADILIQVDGGVSINNARELFDAGCNVLVAGNAIFNSENPTETINKLLNI